MTCSNGNASTALRVVYGNAATEIVNKKDLLVKYLNQRFIILSSSKLTTSSINHVMC